MSRPVPGAELEDWLDTWGASEEPTHALRLRRGPTGNI